LKKLATGLRANIWYNSAQPYGLAGYINDFSSRIVGFGTLRQLRVKNGINKKIYFDYIRVHRILSVKESLGNILLTFIIEHYN